MLFKPQHIIWILHGWKTTTRRIRRGEINPKTGKPNPGVKNGGVHPIKTQMVSKETFGHIEIVDFRWERLGDMTDEDAQREGYDSVDKYRVIWNRIAKRKGDMWDDDLIVLVVDFKLKDTTYSDRTGHIRKNPYLETKTRDELIAEIREKNIRG